MFCAPARRAATPLDALREQALNRQLRVVSARSTRRVSSPLARYYSSTSTDRNRRDRADATRRKPRARTRVDPPVRYRETYEGTEQIQQLVVARAISGLRIE